MPNAINLNRKFKEVAADLAARKNQELRAKEVDGKLVLYSKKVNGIGKWIGNRFFDRAEKRNQARKMVLDHFGVFSQAQRNELMKNVFWAKPTAAAYKVAFELADDHFRKLLALDDATLELYLPAIRDSADKKLLTGDLNFVLAVRKMDRLGQKEAEEEASMFVMELIHDGYNVKDPTLQELAKKFGLDRQAARKLSIQEWAGRIRDLNLEPKELVKLLTPSANEVATDINNNVYRQLR